MHSVLGWDSFCMNDCISAMWQGVSQPSPAEGDEAQVAVISTISSSHCWVSCLSSSSWQYPRHFNPMVTKPGFGTFGSVGRCQILLDNEISISMKLVSKCDAGRQLRWPWPWPNTVDQSQQMTCSPNQHWLWKPDTGLQATWILCLSIPPPDSGTLISKGNERQSTERQSSSLAWVRLFWHCFWFRSGLYTRIAVTVGSPCPGSVCVSDSCLSPLLVKLPHIFNDLCLLWLLVHPFLPHFHHPLNFLWICLDTSTLNCQLLQRWPMRLSLLVEGVNDVNVTVKTAVFPMIVKDWNISLWV